MSKKKPLIMVADDEEDIQMILSMYLESQGFDVITAFDGLDAVERAQESLPDAILMDMMMPVLNGIEVTKKLKTIEKTKHIPVIMLTAAAQSEMADKAMRSGASQYISKPFEPEVVKEAINKALEAPEASQEEEPTSI